MSLTCFVSVRQWVSNPEPADEESASVRVNQYCRVLFDLLRVGVMTKTAHARSSRVDEFRGRIRGRRCRRHLHVRCGFPADSRTQRPNRQVRCSCEACIRCQDRSVETSSEGDIAGVRERDVVAQRPGLGGERRHAASSQSPGRQTIEYSSDLRWRQDRSEFPTARDCEHRCVEEPVWYPRRRASRN